MTDKANTGRWPPVYDWDELGAVIKRLSTDGNLIKGFYAAKDVGPDLCQGDIIRLSSPVPFLDEQANPATEESDDFWAILANTCDLSRSDDENEYGHIIPIEFLGSTGDLNGGTIRSLESYRYYKSFYFPPWCRGLNNSFYAADFTRPVTISKKALYNCAEIEARLSFSGWLLFHSCVVRFLARDDGRFD
ncbi:MAG: hypothetical protein JJT90_10630 [Ectothiorhodospiraceae bacterium]|nr:hypothetical protein [Ectothiorhodospiraceae bacterium]